MLRAGETAGRHAAELLPSGGVDGVGVYKQTARRLPLVSLLLMLLIVASPAPRGKCSVTRGRRLVMGRSRFGSTSESVRAVGFKG